MIECGDISIICDYCGENEIGLESTFSVDVSTRSGMPTWTAEEAVEYAKEQGWKIINAGMDTELIVCPTCLPELQDDIERGKVEVVE